MSHTMIMLIAALALLVLLRLSIRYGDDSLPQIWRDRSAAVDPALVRPEKQHPVGGRYGTYYSPTIFRLALDELLATFDGQAK